MTRTRISTIVSLLLLSNSFIFADSTSINEAFEQGTTSGDITVYNTPRKTNNYLQILLIHFNKLNYEK